jgi:hypothetical protein
MVVEYKKNWKTDSKDAARVLREFRNGNLCLASLDMELARFEGRMSSELIDAMFDIATEAGGSPRTLEKLINWLEGEHGEEVIIAWLNE